MLFVGCALGRIFTAETLLAKRIEPGLATTSQPLGIVEIENRGALFSCLVAAVGWFLFFLFSRPRFPGQAWLVLGCRNHFRASVLGPRSDRSFTQFVARLREEIEGAAALRQCAEQVVQLKIRHPSRPALIPVLEMNRRNRQIEGFSIAVLNGFLSDQLRKVLVISQLPWGRN